MARRPREELTLDENALIDLECVICLELPPGRASQVFAHPPPLVRRRRVTPANAQPHSIDRPRCIAQCFDGHVLCAECLHKHRNSNRGASSRRCPSCSNPLGKPTIRNRALETVIGCIEVQCPFQFGLARCDAHLRRKDLDEHMSTAQAVHFALLDAAQADAIVPVVALISGGLTGGARVAAAEAVQHLALQNCHGLAIVKAGAIAPLRVLLVGACGEWGARKAAMALQNIVASDELIPAIVEADAIRPLVRLLSWGGSRRARHGGQCGTGGRPCAGEPRHARDRSDEGCRSGSGCDRGSGGPTARGIAPLVALLSGGGTEEVKETATRALGNLSCNNTDNKVAITRTGAIAPLMALLNGSGTDGVKAAVVRPSLFSGHD